MDLLEEIKQFTNAKIKLVNDICERNSNPRLSGDECLQMQLSMEPPLDLPVNQTIKQFQSNENISVNGQTQMVAVINRMVSDKNVLIIRDKGNECWICLQYQPMIIEVQREQRISLFIPTKQFSWLEFHEFQTEIYEKINRWLPELKIESPAKIFTLSNCRTSSNSSEQFLLALVYAFGCCLNFPKCHREPFGECKEKVRHAISKALMEKQMPTIEEVWGVQPEN